MWGICVDSSLIDNELFQAVIEYEIVNNRVVVIQPNIGDTSIDVDMVSSLPNPPEFKYGDKVQSVNHENVFGVIKKIMWHFKDKKFLYWISVGEKESKKRYYAEDFLKQKYRISNVNPQDGWISIQDTSSKCYDEDSFINIVKLFQRKGSGVIREVGDMQYEIEGLPVELVFQWDDCLENVIIAKNREETDRAVEFVKKVLEID